MICPKCGVNIHFRVFVCPKCGHVSDEMNHLREEEEERLMAPEKERLRAELESHQQREAKEHERIDGLFPGVNYLLAQADEALLQQDSMKAIKIYEKILSIDPKCY